MQKMDNLPTTGLKRTATFYYPNTIMATYPRSFSQGNRICRGATHFYENLVTNAPLARQDAATIRQFCGSVTYLANRQTQMRLPYHFPLDGIAGILPLSGSFAAGVNLEELTAVLVKQGEPILVSHLRIIPQRRQLRQEGSIIIIQQQIIYLACIH